MTAPTMRVPAHRIHADLGAKFELLADWEVPVSYGTPAAEVESLTSSIGVADITPRGKLDVRGAVDGVLGPDLVGILRARISATWALVLTEVGGADGRIEDLQARAATAAMVTDATHLYAGFLLAGPLVPEALARLASIDARSLAGGAAVGAPLTDVRAILVARDVPSTFVEAYVDSEHGRYVFETLYEVVRGLGGRAVGWGPLRDWGWTPF